MDVDQTLIEAARAGDSDAMTALVRRYETRMFNFARSMTGSDADAEDIAQETFIRALRSLDRFRGDSSFKNWLYHIATNVGRTHHGKRVRQSAVWDRRLEAEEGDAVDLLVAHDADPESVAVRRQAIDRALNMLPYDLRIALILRDVEGLEYREIAQSLDIPIGTVMSRIFRARQRLRPVLSELRSRGTDTARSTPPNRPATPAAPLRVMKGSPHEL